MQNASKQRRFKVLHTQVDGWPRDFVFAESDLPEGGDINRLLAIKAVEEVDAPRTGDTPPGPHTVPKSRKEADPPVQPVPEQKQEPKPAK